jgi:hypothetical protein
MSLHRVAEQAQDSKLVSLSVVFQTLIHMTSEMLRLHFLAPYALQIDGNFLCTKL